jgi:hypothetical protein
MEPDVNSFIDVNIALFRSPDLLDINEDECEHSTSLFLSTRVFKKMKNITSHSTYLGLSIALRYETG